MAQSTNKNQSFFKTNSVFDFSGFVQNAPKASNFVTLQKKIKDLASDPDADSIDEFAARSSQYMNQFENETTAQLDFINDDNDFSLNQVSGFQGQTARLRTRQSNELNDTFDSALGLVQSRETKRLKKEEVERLDAETDLQLQLKAAAIGVKDPAGLGRKELINAISSKTIENQKPKGGGGSGVGFGYQLGDAGSFFGDDAGGGGVGALFGDGPANVSPTNPAFDVLNGLGLVVNQSTVPAQTQTQNSSPAPLQSFPLQNSSPAPNQSLPAQNQSFVLPNQSRA